MQALIRESAIGSRRFLPLIGYVAAFAVIVTDLIVLSHSSPDGAPWIPIGGLIDLTLIVPLLCLVTQKGETRSPWLLVRVSLFGFALAWWLLRDVFPLLSWVERCFTVLLTVFEFWIVYRVIRSIRQPSMNIESTCQAVAEGICGKGRLIQ